MAVVCPADMLATLRVRNLVLIDELELHLGSGLNVLTGETGAGKSILVDALSLLLGGRASPELVRSGASEGEVEALFELDHELRARLGDLVSGEELVLRRVVTSAGRSRAYLNGRLCTVAELAEIGPRLVDIASQHESVALTDPATHLGYLDAFAKLTTERDGVGARVDALRASSVQLEEARERAKSKAERQAFLEFQLVAIDDVSPVEGEDETLGEERLRLRHADRILGAARAGASRLDEGENAVSDVLARVIADLRAVAAFDPGLGRVADQLDAAQAEIVDAGRTLARRVETMASDPARLEEVEARLFALEKLRRQYGPLLADVLSARERLHDELAGLEGTDARIEELEGEVAAHLREAASMSAQLSSRRAAGAKKLGASITKELGALGMGTAKVVVEVTPLPTIADSLSVGGARLSRDGIDRVEFLIAPNKGVEPRPLRKVASGGELSRALLALKRSLADMAPAGTYVFDEVDTGVGGAIAERIGRALADIAVHRQVLCITHLAPIAAFGQTHFVVEKAVVGDMTRSSMSEVKGKVRVQEIARMISGAKVTDAARKAAAELLAASASASQPS